MIQEKLNSIIVIRSRNKLLLILFLFIQSSLCQAQEVLEPEKIEAVIGIERIIQLDEHFNTNVTTNNKNLLHVSVLPSKKQLILNGLREGTLTVRVYKTNGEDLLKVYTVKVTKNQKSQEVVNLKELIGDIEGINIGIKGEQVVVDGYIVRPDDVGRLFAVLEGYPQVLKLFDLSPLAQLEIAKHMSRGIIERGYSDIRVRVLNKRFWVEGTVSSQTEVEDIQAIAQAYLPDRITRLYQQFQEVQAITQSGSPIIYSLTINPKKRPPEPAPKMIKVSAQFVELSKDYQRVFGFRWAPTLTGNGGEIRIGRDDDGGVGTSSSGALSGIISSLFPRLETARGAGYARIVQSAYGLAVSGQRINVTRNTSEPFSLGTGEFTQAQSAQVGISMDVTPEVVQDENIKMAINISIQLASGSTPQGTPRTTNNAINIGEINVPNKQSAAIGGVSMNSLLRIFDRNPQGGSTGPDDDSATSVLFNFERSKSTTKNKSQFVVFVTPEIIENAALGTADIKRKFRRRRR